MSTKNYDVGYGKPPEANRFKKGQSGNSKGRPQKSKNTYNILADELSRVVALKENGQEVKLTKREAMLRHMVNKAVQGDSKAMFFVFNQLLQLDQREELKAEMSAMLLKDDQAILKRFMESNALTTPAETTNASVTNVDADVDQLEDSNSTNFNN
jgi:hypothetical protein